MSVFETTTEVLERLSVKTGKSVVMLPDAKTKLKSICSLIDDMISEFDAETYTVSIVPDNLVLEINVLVQEMIIEDCTNHNFFKLLEMVDSFGFSVEDDNISFNTSTKNLFYIVG